MSLQCPQCGKAVEGGWVACPHCAAHLTAESCQSCGKIIEATWKVCPYCGGGSKDDDVPELPRDDVLERKGKPGQEELRRAESLLMQLKSAADDIDRALNGPPPSLWSLLTKKDATGFEQSFKHAMSIRDDIYESLDAQLSDVDFESPYSQLLKAHRKRKIDPDEISKILRDEIRHVRHHFEL